MNDFKVHFLKSTGCDVTLQTHAYIHCFNVQAMWILLLLGWVFLPVYIASGVSMNAVEISGFYFLNWSMLISITII